MTLQPEVTIARHIATCRDEQLSGDVLAVAKRSIVDGVAAMVAGRGMPGVNALLTLVDRWGGLEEARVFTTGRRVPAPQAAWVNGAYIRASELDDCTDTVPVHPTAAVLPALLALADITPMSGKDLLRSLVIGQDLLVRFGLGITKNVMQSGRGDLYRLLAATAGVAAALRLDEHQTLNALGLSMSYASGDLQGVLESSMALWVQYGNCATAAVQSGLLAQIGVTGPASFLVGRGGYLTAFEPEHDLDVLLGELGARFEGTRISVKPYASCRATHSMIDLARAFRAQYGAAFSQQVERIDINVSPEVYNLVANPREVKIRPETGAAAQFAAHFITASALKNGRMTLADSGPVPLRDPATLDLAEKIHIHANPACRTRAIIGRTEMTIRTRAGEQMTRSDDCPLGAPANPVPAALLRAKLFDCVAHCGCDIAPGDLDDFIDQVENIERAPLARAPFDLFA